MDTGAVSSGDFYRETAINTAANIATAGVYSQAATTIAYAKGEISTKEFSEQVGGAGLLQLASAGTVKGAKAIKAKIGKTGGAAGSAQPAIPKRIYSARELLRRAEERGPYHNFPESFNEVVFRGNRKVVSQNYTVYSERGSINGRTGAFEIGVRPGTSGSIEVIEHRFFRADP